MQLRFRRFINKLICTFLLIILVGGFVLGLDYGYKLGIKSICLDLAFYHQNANSIRACEDLK